MMKSALTFTIDDAMRGQAPSNQPLLRIRDYMNAMLVPAADGHVEGDYMPMNDSVLIALFGALPDYRDPAQEKLLRQVDGWGASETIRILLEKGVDLRGADGRPVRIWRDVAVMVLMGRSLHQDEELFIAA